MPIPLVIWGVAALGGGFLSGAISRQPTINNLHSQVERLQAEVEHLQAEVQRLQILVEEQNRQINALTMKYHAMKGINFIEKAKAKDKAKGAVMYSYCLKQYLELKYSILNKHYLPNNEESAFLDSFSMVLEGTIGNTKEDNAKKIYIKEYIRSLNAKEIDNLEECPIQNTIKRIEVA